MDRDGVNSSALKRRTLVLPSRALFADWWIGRLIYRSLMRYWWVNQNQTYRAEVRGSFMWSPKQNANGARNQFYENMREVSPGDVVFSFCDTRIKAIGVVTGTAQTGPKPTSALPARTGRAKDGSSRSTTAC